MALIIRSLAKNSLPTAEGDLYGGSTMLPAGKAAIVKNIILVNNGGATTVNLYIRRGTGTSFRIAPKDLSLAAGAAFVLDAEITMEGGSSSTADAIRGVVASGGAVHYVINGVERDQ